MTKPLAGRVTPIDDPAAMTRVIGLIGAKYWFATPMIWIDRWLGRAGLGPRGGAFRVDVR